MRRKAGSPLATRHERSLTRLSCHEHFRSWALRLPDMVEDVALFGMVD